MPPVECRQPGWQGKLRAASLATVLGCALASSPALGQGGQYRNTDNKNLLDHTEGTYPAPYKKPVVAEVTAQLKAIHGYMDQATPTRIINKKTGD